MAIYVNGIKVAGRGNSGKSPYMLAVEGGYTGTETEFNAELKAIGTAVSSVTDKIEECKTIVSNAQTSFNTIINNTRTELNTLIGTTTNDFNNLVANATTAATNASNSATLAQQASANVQNITSQAIADIETAKNEAIKKLESYNVANKVDKTGDIMSGFLTLSANPTNNLHAATKDYVDTKVSSVVTDVFHYGTLPPSNTKLLWIDSNTSSGGLKYYNGDAWTHVPFAWQ